MPGKVKVKIIAGRNLPVMDRSSDTTDAYVEIKLGNTTHKTDVCRKSLNPQWNSEWYRFEADDSELQDEPLQIRLMDYDTYSANDAIGKVYLNLNPLLIPSMALSNKYGWTGDANVEPPTSSVMSGWLPVFDTMHGIRGEVNVTVKVELFSDFNKFRQSSCGVPFFCSPTPHGYQAQVIHGFVEELVVNDDPEYQWIDKIRTPRASNEARQTLFFKLSGELQRKIGVKALDLGGNAVIGYSQCFDLEGESGIVARGIGTVVTLIKHQEMQQQLDIGIAEEKALSYLKFLAFDNGLKLDNDNFFDRFTLPNPHNTLSTSLSHHVGSKVNRKLPSLLRQTSQPTILSESLPFSLKTCISSKSLSDDIRKEIALKQFLQQDEIGCASNVGLSRKIKSFKDNMLAKKMAAMKSTIPECHSLTNNTKQTSLIDLRDVLKKKKPQNKSYMAELLVKSIIHAHTSLDCISECHDTAPALSLEEDVDSSKDESLRKDSLKSIISKTVSESYLLLPDQDILTYSNTTSDASSSDDSDSVSDINDSDSISFNDKSIQNKTNFVYQSLNTQSKSQNADEEHQLGFQRNINTSKIISTAPVVQQSENLFLYPSHRGKLTKTLSKSCEDIPTSDSSIPLKIPKIVEKSLANLRNSALFKSIIEKTDNGDTHLKSKLDNVPQVLSSAPITHNNANLFLFPPKKGKLVKSLSKSCEDIPTTNTDVSLKIPLIVEKSIANLTHSALFKSIIEKEDNGDEDYTGKQITSDSIFQNENETLFCRPRKNKLVKSLSKSCEDISVTSLKIPQIVEKSIANLRHSALFKSIVDRKDNEDSNIYTAPVCQNNKNLFLFPSQKPKLVKSLSKSCENIPTTDISLKIPQAVKISIANLRHSALFKSIMEKKNDGSKTDTKEIYSAPVAQDIDKNIFLYPYQKGTLRKSLSKSCEDVSTTNSNLPLKISQSVERNIEKLRHSAVFKSIVETTDINYTLQNPSNDTIDKIVNYPHKRGKLTRTFSISCEDVSEDSSSTIIQDNFNRYSSKINRGLSKSYTNVSLLFEQNLNSSTIEKLTPKASFNNNYKLKRKINRGLSKSCTDVCLIDYDDIKSKFKKLTADILYSFKREECGKKSKLARKLSKSLTDVSSEKYNEKCIDSNNLLKTAVHLFEKVNSSNKEEIKYNSKSNPDLRKLPFGETAMHTMLMEKVNLMALPTVPVLPNLEDESQLNHEADDLGDKNLIKTAVETMLIEKIDMLAAQTPVSQRMKEKFEKQIFKSISISDPDLRSNFIKSTIDSLPSIETSLSLDWFKANQNKNIKKSLSQSTPDLIYGDLINKFLINNFNLKSDGLNNYQIASVTTIPTKELHATKLDHTEQCSNGFDNQKSALKNNSLIKTAMQTMLIDKINTLAPTTQVLINESDELPESDKKHDHEFPKLDKVKDTLHTVLDKIHVISSKAPVKSELNKKSNSKENVDEPVESDSLIKTAMQTMLIDKVNILVPNPDSISITNNDNDKSESENVKHEHPHLDKIKSVVHNVIDKVSIPSPKLLILPRKESIFSTDHSSLTKTAVETILLDTINTVVPNSPILLESNELENLPQFVDKNQDNENQKIAKQVNTAELLNVEHSVQKNLIIDDTNPINLNASKKKHSLLNNIKKRCKSFKMHSPKTIFSKFISKKPKKSKLHDDGLVTSAMSTILIDKLNSVEGILHCSTNEPEGLNLQINTHAEQLTSQGSSKALPKTHIENTDIIASSSTSSTISTSFYTEELKPLKPYHSGNNDNDTAVIAVSANFVTNPEHAPCLYTSDRRTADSPIPEKDIFAKEKHGHQRTESTGGKMSQSPARLNTIPCIHRRSSDSDLSITPKGNSLTGSDRSGGALPTCHHTKNTAVRPTVDNFDMMEYPFLTMSKYPPGFILHLGGAVSARSVKLLERVTNIEEPETRDTWWSELRMEIRTHARALNCNAVLAYTESTSMCDEICVLSASGTAAVIIPFSGDSNDSTTKIAQLTESPEQEPVIEFSSLTSQSQPASSCRICHVPYSESNMSFRINMLYCSVCKSAKVPDILLATIEMPEGLPLTGRGCFLQSYVCRPKRDLKGELNAKEISESLPFLEYELHRLLVNKMRVKAMNAIFGLKVRITIGEKMLVGVATGTAVFLTPLPPPALPKLVAGNETTDEKQLTEMQKLLVDTVKKNKEIYEIKDMEPVVYSKFISDNEDSDDEKSSLDMASANKDSCVLEVDDAEDIEVINLLVEPRPPDGFHVVNTEYVPGLEDLEIVRNLQMFTHVWRAKIVPNPTATAFGKYFQKLLQSVYFKLRRMIPCALCDLQFRVDLPEPDEIQFTLLGMALGLGDPIKLNKFKRKNTCPLPSKDMNKKSDDELIFNLEEDYIPENNVSAPSQGLLNPQTIKYRQKSPQRLRVTTKQRHMPLKERHGVDITPLSYVPGGKIERYLGYLNFFFIRETTSIREGGGLSAFVHTFITEILAIVRSHITALGGNAMVSYFMTECALYHNAHKNQGQCLINVGGDVVFVSYFNDDN